MIKNFPTEAAYAAAAKPTIESQAAMVEADKAVHYDGVNVIADVPRVGDAVFLDESNNPVILSAATIIKANIPSAWEYVGEVLEVMDNYHVRVIHKDISQTRKFADVVQFDITAISDTSIKFWLKMAGDYANFVGIEVTLTSAEINATSAAEIAAAIEAAGNTDNVGYDKHKYWAYLADADGNKVTSGGTKIVVQCDSWLDYRQYQCSDNTHALVGVTMAFTTWGMMPENSNLGFRVNGRKDSEHLMNLAKGVAYYGTNGRTPTADVPVNAAAGIVKRACFENPSDSAYAYCAALREAYGTYENYVKSEYLVDFPQKCGVFSMPDGDTLTKLYGPLTAEVKDGTTKAKFPALNWPLTVGFNAAGMAVGDWHLWGVREGCMMMRDAVLALINATREKMGVTQISNATTRWFAQRYGVHTAWHFHGYTGNLTTNAVTYALQVGAVTLLKYK